ncbi:iron transporter [Azotobacter salinestris]|uniref:iron transporter n=1 Tax=Azotobacter salinestris TaxID=69964 RepID=UPI001FCA5C05|nr:iron transporter [Azotobacter salinestris]
MSRRLSLPPARRAWLDVALRVTAAVFGGYVLTYATTAALARLLPLARFNAVMVATLLSFALYTGIVLWVFAAASMRRVWLGIALSLPLAAIGFWPAWFGGAF